MLIIELQWRVICRAQCFKTTCCVQWHSQEFKLGMLKLLGQGPSLPCPVVPLVYPHFLLSCVSGCAMFQMIIMSFMSSFDFILCCHVVLGYVCHVCFAMFCNVVMLYILHTLSLHFILCHVCYYHDHCLCRNHYHYHHQHFVTAL